MLLKMHPVSGLVPIPHPPITSGMQWCRLFFGIGEPVAEKIHAAGQKKGDDHSLAAADHTANQNDEGGQGGKEQSGFELVSHGSFFPPSVTLDRGSYCQRLKYGLPAEWQGQEAFCLRQRLASTLMLC